MNPFYDLREDWPSDFFVSEFWQKNNEKISPKKNTENFNKKKYRNENKLVHFFFINYAEINVISRREKNMDDFGSHGVELYIYDMTQGMARMMSPLLLGKYLKTVFVYA